MKAEHPREVRPRLASLDGTKARRLQALGAGYSWFVKITKFALPVAALVIIGVVFSSLSENPIQRQIAELPKEEKTTPGQVELVKAKYEGTDEKGQKYVLTADKAVRVNETENVVNLENPKADITLQHNGWLAVHADKGSFDNAAALLELAGNVKIFHDAGYELNLQNAHVDLAKKTASTELPVAGQGPAGEIRAQNLSITDNGMKIVFGGPATLVLHLRNKKAPG